MAALTLDPVGYFLIRPNLEKKEVEIAFCKYKQVKGWYKNDIETWKGGKSVEELMKWIEDNNLISFDDHRAYMRREIQTCFECMKKGTAYVQD